MNYIERLNWRSGALNDVAKACQQLLANHPVAMHGLDYINGRLSKESQEKFGFGYFPSNHSLKHLFALVDRDVLERLGLVYSFGGALQGLYHQHNLILPLRDVYGNTLALLGRSILSSEELDELSIKKYKYSFGYNNQIYLFGLGPETKQAIIDKNCVICVEGQFDCISCQEAGIKNVVALGCSKMSRYQFFQLNRLTNNILLMLDNDEGGRTGIESIKSKYSFYAKIQTLQVPVGYKDIDELLRREQHLRRTVVSWLSGINRSPNG